MNLTQLTNSSRSRLARRIAIASMRLTTLGLTALGVTLAVGLAMPDAAQAQAGKGGKGKAPPPAPTAPSRTKKAVTIAPGTLSWGQAPKQVAAVYEKQFEEDFKPRYRKVSPGPSMTALDAELAELKQQVRRSLVMFKDVPTGYDETPLRPEYTYGNKEGVMNITRDGRERYFFFIQDKLWKIVDEHKLGEGAPWGADFDAAAKKLASYYEVAGRMREPTADNGLSSKEVDWTDGRIHVRAVERGSSSFALIFEDEATVAQLPQLRTATIRDPNAMDPTVADVIRKPSAAPGPPPPPEKKPKK